MSLVWSPSYSTHVSDSDAQTYIEAVETADNQALEVDTAAAINRFVIGCKDDGIWDAMKASCILAGARTLSGALVPLKGTAPTNNNFVAADYNRKTGLVGNASNKYLNSNRGNATDPINDQHMAVYATTPNTGTKWYMGAGQSHSGSTNLFSSNSSLSSRNRNSGYDTTASGNSAGFLGMSRDNSSSYVVRGSSTSSTISRTSQTPYNFVVHVFHSGGSNSYFADGRLSFYSIGESLDLAKLDARVSTLMTDIGDVIL